MIIKTLDYIEPFLGYIVKGSKRKNKQMGLQKGK